MSNRRRIIALTDSDSDVEHTQDAPDLGKSNSVVGESSQKSEITIERENQMKYLKKAYPKVQSFVCCFFYYLYYSYVILMVSTVGIL